LDTLTFVDGNAPEFSQRFYRTPSNQLVTPDPPPTGPYPVGTFSMLLTNTNRANAKFMVSFWYPAVAQAGVLPTKYVEPQVAEGENYGGFASQVAAFYSHSLSNAPLATNLAAYPIVLYDPSYGGPRGENTDKTEDLAIPRSCNS
jgi:predicted dienelactone hydrolase